MTHGTMRAMRLARAGAPLAVERLPLPQPGPGEVLLRVRACGVCRTDLHLADGELAARRLPLTPGHEIVGEVVGVGEGVDRFAPGERIGVPWLGWTCGRCEQCLAGRENLCAQAQFTGWDRDGGYAEYARADARFCFALPARYADEEAAPLLCAGLIGYRAYAMAGPAGRIGIWGFGAAAHLLTQLAAAQGREVYAFTRPGDEAAQALARACGARWAGDAGSAPPAPLEAAILFAPVGAHVPEALARVRPGGVVVCGGIHMSDIPSFPYALLWGERSLRSVANLTRADGETFLRIAAEVPLRVALRRYALERANEALDDLRTGRLAGVAVLVP